MLRRHTIVFPTVQLLDRHLLQNDCTVFSEAQSIVIIEHVNDNRFLTVKQFPLIGVISIDILHRPLESSPPNKIFFYEVSRELEARGKLIPTCASCHTNPIQRMLYLNAEKRPRFQVLSPSTNTTLVAGVGTILDIRLGFAIYPPNRRLPITRSCHVNIDREKLPQRPGSQIWHRRPSKG